MENRVIENATKDAKYHYERLVFAARTIVSELEKIKSKNKTYEVKNEDETLH